MPRGIPRSWWPTKLARSLGWRPQRLRALLNKKGMKAPYEDLEGALKILDAASVSTKKWRAQQARAGAGAAAVGLARGAKKGNSVTFSKKLIRRLARLLPEGDSSYGCSKVRNLFKSGGYSKSNWPDEATALQIFKDAGIPTEGFEHATPGIAPITVTADPVILADIRAADGHDVLSRRVSDLTRRLNEMTATMKTARDILITYESRLFSKIKKGKLSSMEDPLEIPLSALNELRTLRYKD